MPFAWRSIFIRATSSDSINVTCALELQRWNGEREPCLIHCTLASILYPKSIGQINWSCSEKEKTGPQRGTSDYDKYEVYPISFTFPFIFPSKMKNSTHKHKRCHIDGSLSEQKWPKITVNQCICHFTSWGYFNNISGNDRVLTLSIEMMECANLPNKCCYQLF